MANVFKKNDAGIRQLLKSNECLKVVEKYANKYPHKGYVKPFVGYDRAKCFILKENK